MRLTMGRLLPLLVFALLAVFLWRGLFLKPQELPSVQLGRQVPVLDLPVLGDAQQRFMTTTWQGRVALLNVWASWCEACIDEQVFLMQLAANHTLPIYGLNYKDTPQKAQQWLAKWGNPYQLIGVDQTGKAAIDLGVYGTPETFLIDSHGIIRYRHVGALDERSWQQEFLPRIQQLRG